MIQLEFTSEGDTVYLILNDRKEPFAKIIRPRCLDSEKALSAEQVEKAMNEKFKTP